jgi:hypothetical protein
MREGYEKVAQRLRRKAVATTPRDRSLSSTKRALVMIAKPMAMEMNANVRRRRFGDATAL